MPSQEATSAAVLNATPLSLLLAVLFMVVLAMCGPPAMFVPEVMVEGKRRLPGNVRPLISFPSYCELLEVGGVLDSLSSREESPQPGRRSTTLLGEES